MLTRWDPFREMMIVRNARDRRFDGNLAVAPSSWKSFNWSVALDVVENDDEFIVKASLPGINPDDLEITFSDSRLTIKGEVTEEEELEEAHYHLRERRYGSFTRSIKLPSGIEADKIEAKYDSGILKLHLPKVEEVKPKKITIKTSAPEVIDASAEEVISEN
ncbi:MAG: Hsp20/alpha crystallin family protein [Chloroflexota bacterium]|nr:MAG: Hsp20/alpha crystallin family protein [Chloroflexota bacterium]